MQNLSLRRLGIFATVADAGSFAAAADRLDIAQPSVSAHIEAREAAIGGPLFERRRGAAPVLTELGQICLGHAREMLATADRMAADIRDHLGAARASVVFACQRSLATTALSGAIADFARLRRDIGLTLRIGYREDVVRDAKTGGVDVACLLSNSDIPGLPTQVIAREELVLVAAPSHPLAQRRKVAPRAIGDHDFVGSPPSSGFGAEVLELLRGAGVPRFRTVAQATDYQSLREFVVAGVGISCTLRKAVTRDADAGALAILDLDAPPLTMDVRLANLKGKRAKPHVEAFTRFLVDSLRAEAR